MTLTMAPPDAPTHGSHIPVLAQPVLDVLGSVPAGTYVDCTLGLGGHAALLLDAHPGLTLLGLDRDAQALARAAEGLARFGDRVLLRHARSDALADLLAEEGIDDVTAMLADLGVSSPQIDRPERGFSYRPDRDGPLDMRMDTSRGPTAADLLAELDEDALVRILRQFGDEPHARRIARATIDAEPRTTGELAAVVRSAVPAARRRSGDPAKRVFQALRIAVNDELGTLDRTLDVALAALAPGGRLALISFHSLEDRMVKTRFRAAAEGGCTCPPGLPCVCGFRPTVRLLRRKAWVAGQDEVAANPRAASARLRAVEALPVDASPGPEAEARP